MVEVGDQGRFAFAIGSTSLDEFFVDYSLFGEFRAYYYMWNALKGSQEDYGLQFQPLKLRQCTLDDFNVDNSTLPNRFYKF